MKLDLPLLSEITEISAAPGNESKIRKFLSHKLSTDSRYILSHDSIGNLYVKAKNGIESQQWTMVSAHIDEISLIITHIDKNGFLKFHTLGGFDWKTLINQKVLIHGRNQTIPGIIGSKAVHLMSEEEKKKSLSTDQLFIDTGLSSEELDGIISIGDTVTRERSLFEIGHNLTSKAFDNRISVYLLLQNLLNPDFNPQPDIGFCGVFTVQEEVGIRGARIASETIKPTIGINLDVTIANDTPGSEPHKTVTALGRGPALKIIDNSVISDIYLNRFIESIALNENITLQKEILTAGGTDTSAMQYLTGVGAKVTCISVPTRYVHSTVETVNKEDVRLTQRLLLQTLNQLHTFSCA